MQENEALSFRNQQVCVCVRVCVHVHACSASAVCVYECVCHVLCVCLLWQEPVCVLGRRV